MAEIRGGQRLERALAELAARLGRRDTLRVGFLRNAKYPDGTQVALIATFQDFGTGTIPPRPFFRNMVARKQREWPAAIANLLRATNYDVPRTLQMTGDAIAGQLRQSIIDTNAPPLAPSTIARKGFDKPLILTGHMLNSIDYEIKS
jgi:hypothetical protein